VSRLAASQKIDRSAVEKQFFQEMRPSSLLQRFATPAEVAALVTFVASPLSSATNGAALRVDGGVVRSIV
jgi:NAD(P)-dependent dehydrogenase (short-subunit alcohol dehydrogenase family)